MDKQFDKDTLYVGFGREAFSPDFPIGMAGYGDADTRRCEGIVDDIYATCLAMTEGDETILLYTIDICALSRAMADELREKVTAATGIPGEKIFGSATHNHSGPGLYMNDPNFQRYYDLYYGAVVKAAQAALADRAPTKLSYAKPVVEGMVFMRHYIMEDGSYAGANFGNLKTLKAVAHAGPSDLRMGLVKFARESKEDILIVNWQAHADSAYDCGFRNISSAWIGPMRTKLEEKTGMKIAYFTGASGNQSTNSSLENEKHDLNWIGYGQKLADHVLEALPSLQPAVGKGIKTTRAIHTINVDHSWDNMIEQARHVYKTWKTVGRDEAIALRKAYDFSSVHQASAIIQRYDMGKSSGMEINAFAVDGIGFVTATYEMFSESGMYIKDNSPFDMTVICTGNNTYLPSKQAFEYRCYEADCGRYEKGAAETLAEELVKMLHIVKE